MSSKYIYSIPEGGRGRPNTKNFRLLSLKIDLVLGKVIMQGKLIAVPYTLRTY